MSSAAQKSANAKLTDYLDFDEGNIQRVSHRPPLRIEIIEPDAAWPATFAKVESLIRGALGPAALEVNHVGSTSVPDLPAKPIIDVDLVVTDPTAEDTYVAALERAGFQFLFREPAWYEHRFFGLADPYTNLHVFGPDASETTRHLMFRDWLREHPDDCAKYAAAKRRAAEISEAAGESVNEYNRRKHDVIADILHRMFKAHGLLDDEAAPLMAEETQEGK